MIAGRALIVGLGCALLHNAIVILGDRMGLHYALSLMLSFVIVVIVAYWLHSGWTFSGAIRTKASFGRYVLVASGNYPLSLASMFVLVDLAGVSVPIATPLTTVLLAIFNFLGVRWTLRARRAPAWRA